MRTDDLIASWEHNGGQVTRRQDGTVFYGDCGLDWQIKRSPTYFQFPVGQNDAAGEVHQTKKIPNRLTLYRSDTNDPLGIVSPKYKVVQPLQMIQTFDRLATTHDMELEFAGSVDGGRKLWGLANCGRTAAIHGNDNIALYMMFLTACDGSMSTVGVYTTLRAFCLNMLQMVMNEQLFKVRVPHTREYDVEEFSRSLMSGLHAWEQYKDEAQKLSERVVTDEEVAKFLVNVMGDPKKSIDSDEQPNIRGMRQVLQLFAGEGRGSSAPSSKRTAWGLVQAVTEFNDHHRRAHNPSTRFASAAFGKGNTEKNKAWTEALKLVA